MRRGALLNECQNIGKLPTQVAAGVEESDALLVLNVGGLDDGSAQQLYARHVYSWRDIRWHHRYKDVTSVSPQERFLLDYTKFHDVVADE